MQRVADAVVADARGDRAAGRALARAIVAEIAGVDAGSVSIVQRCPDCGGPHGRPVVMSPLTARDVVVSLSHAGDRRVVAARRGRRIGVDAERRDAVPGRLEALRALLPASAIDPLRRWTEVEAILKADGRGLRVDPATVLLEREGGGLVGAVPGTARRYNIHEVELSDDLVVSLAVER